jgi:tetratricopeptide (TPR) repeat protein
VEATLLRLHSDYSEAILTLRRAISESGREARTTGECLLSITDMYIHLHQVDEAQKAFEAAEAIGPVSRRLRAFLMLTAARLAQARGEDRLAQTGYEESFDFCRKVHAGDLALESIAAWSRLVELYSGPEVALRLISEALPEARQAGRMDVVFNLQLVRARSYTRLGQDQQAEVEMRTIRSEAEALGYMTQLTHAFSSLASLAERAGRWPEAINYAKHAIGLAERLGDDLLLGHTLAVLCATENRQAAALGDPNSTLSSDAISHGERSLEVLSKLPPSDSLVLANTYLAEAYADRHERTKAEQYYNTAMRLVEQLQLPWLKEILITELKPKVFAAT